MYFIASSLSNGRPLDERGATESTARAETFFVIRDSTAGRAMIFATGWADSPGVRCLHRPVRADRGSLRRGYPPAQAQQRSTLSRGSRMAATEQRPNPITNDPLRHHQHYKSDAKRPSPYAGGSSFM